MNSAHFRLKTPESKGAALIIVLAFVVLLTGLVVAYFSRTTIDRQLAQSSFNNTAADLLARSALDIVVSDLKQEIVNNPTITQANIQPTPYGTPTPGQTAIPNLLRRSFSGDPTGRTSSVNSAAASANGRLVNLARWNSHYLIPRASTATAIDSTPVSSFTAPDWVLMTSQGPASAPVPNAVIGRSAYAVYDEGGLLDMTLAGFPTWTNTGGGGNPNPTPTPWMVNVGRKGIITFADLTALPAAPTTTFPQAQISNIVGWRNYATTQQSGTFGSSIFQVNALNKQDTYGNYLLDFGDPPFTDPSTYPFTSVATDVSSNRTDQALITRQELLKLRSSLGFSQNLLQYLGTYSRERNRPAPDWPSLNGRLTDRFDITNLGLVKPNPSGAPTSRGRSQNKSKGRGRIKGDAGSILSLFGLLWVPGTSTDPSTGQTIPNTDLRYWGHWSYVGEQGPGEPNSNALAHIPVLRGRLEFLKILDYALTQANANSDDPASPAAILGVAASLIDQYDDPADDAEPKTGTHTTIIAYNGGYVVGWENGDTNDPHEPLSVPTPTPGTTPIVINHAFSNVGEFGYGLKTTNGFQPLDLRTSTSTDRPVLDFFSYNPVSSAYPRAGIVNLNTKNAPILAAILKSALKTDAAAGSNPPSPVVSQSEAMTAAQTIVTETSVRPVLNRGDVARLANVAGSAIGSSKEQMEAISRALAEVGQARTWNLMVDVIAQTGKYKPTAQSLTASDFIVEGEKRYWLHIAVGRDLNAGSVDVIGQQLEEVLE